MKEDHLHPHLHPDRVVQLLVERHGVTGAIERLRRYYPGVIVFYERELTKALVNALFSS